MEEPSYHVKEEVTVMDVWEKEGMVRMRGQVNWVALEERENAYAQTSNQITKKFSILCMAYSSPLSPLTPLLTPTPFFGVNVWVFPMWQELTYIFSFELCNTLRGGSYYLLPDLPEVSQLLKSRASTQTRIFWSESYILKGSQSQNFSSSEDITRLETNIVQIWGIVILITENVFLQVWGLQGKRKGIHAVWVLERD